MKRTDLVTVTHGTNDCVPDQLPKELARSLVTNALHEKRRPIVKRVCRFTRQYEGKLE